VTNLQIIKTLQLRLISYSSVDSFIKRDYVLDILDKYKVNPKFLEHLQKTTAREQQHEADLNIFDSRLETKERSMDTEKGFLVQQRREYYNDFEDCLREYKNAKIKSLQKQTKVHLSDGDNGDSDSDYVDCADINDLKHQSTLSSKSMPHVPSGNYQDNFCQQLELKPTTKRNETEEQTQTSSSSSLKAQLNTNYEVLRIKHETSAQLTSHNNDHNQTTIDSSCSNPLVVAVKTDCKVSSTSEKSITIDDVNIIEARTPIHIPSTSDTKLHVNQTVVGADKQSKANEAVKVTPVQIVANKDEQPKRKSCKKKRESVIVHDPTQR
jgi:hypothetical protein